MKPKLVFVANHVPIPWVNGIAFQEWEDLRLLARSHEVTLLALDNGDLRRPEAVAALERLRRECGDVVIFPRPHSPKFISAIRRGRGIASRLPSAMAHNIRADCRHALAARLAEEPGTDIYLSNFFVASICSGLHRQSRVVIRLHNHESEFVREAVGAEGSLARKGLSVLDLALTRAAERNLFGALQSQDCILAPSEADRLVIEKRYRTAARVDYLPLCPPMHPPGEPSTRLAPADQAVIFTGILDSHFNMEGIAWFVQHVWPLVRQRAPAARLLIAGHNPSPSVLALGSYSGVEVIANPRDMSDLLRQSSVAIAPIFHGAGVKQKCLEAFSYGVPLVTTRKGAEGLGARAGRDYLLADTVQEYASAVVELLQDASLRQRMAASAQNYLESAHSPAARRATLDRALGLR